MVHHARKHRGVILLPILAVAIVALLAPGSVPNASASAHTVRIGSLSLNLGEQAAVDLEALSIASPSLGSWTIDIVYDPASISVVGCTAEPAGSSVCNPAFGEDAVRVAGFTGGTLTGDLTLATITFACYREGAGNLTVLVRDFIDATPGDPQPIPVAIESGTTACTKDASGDTDGDTLPNDVDPDDDGDGCTDVRELGADPVFGGMRNPHVFWDFYDPSQDGAVALSDFLVLLQRFGTTDDGGQAPVNRSSDPLTTPDPGPGNYHPRFDRGGVIGPNAWNLGPPDGTIALTDFFSLLVQFGHTCA